MAATAADRTEPFIGSPSSSASGYRARCAANANELFPFVQDPSEGTAAFILLHAPRPLTPTCPGSHVGTRPYGPYDSGPGRASPPDQGPQGETSLQVPCLPDEPAAGSRDPAAGRSLRPVQHHHYRRPVGPRSGLGC